MELRQLEHLLAVVETGSLTGAASQVGLTQQALSKSLSRLEQSLGGKLFDREARGMTLTRLGETVAEHGRDVVAGVGRLTAAVDSELGLKHGKLIVGMSPIAATTEPGRRVSEFAAKNRNLRLDIEAGIDRDFAAALYRGQIDLAISSQIAGHHDKILVEDISEEPWGIAGREAHPVLATATSLRDFDDTQWILGKNTELLNEAIEQSFEDVAARRPRPSILTTSVLFTLTTLSVSNYLSILPRSLCQSVQPLLWRDFSDGAWTTPIFLMRRNRAHMSHAVKRLLDVLHA